MDKPNGFAKLNVPRSISFTLETPVNDTGSEEVAHSRRSSCVPLPAGMAFGKQSETRQTGCGQLQEFTQYTTLHGLRYIALNDAYIGRRLIWLGLTLVCCTLLVFQIIDRVQYFYQSPVTVNFKVNYNQSLMFPALTICNQNAFRATLAQRAGLYQLIEHLYRNGSYVDGNVSRLMDYADSNITLENLFRGVGHSREDFIVSCTWDGHPCGPADFATTYTDHGLCYTFNTRRDGEPVLNASSSGSDHGLKLTLNVENYDAMPGPHDATGIKLLASDQVSHPRVAEIGVAIPTGAHAFVGLGVVVINNLPRPHGDCGVVPLHSSPVYSAELCQLECAARHLAQGCGCRRVHMPDLTGETPVCTLHQLYNCCLQMPDHDQAGECICPTSCNYLLFDPSVSYASTSSYAKDSLLAEANSHLRTRFLEARETTERMNNDKYERFDARVTDASGAFNTIYTLLTIDIMDKLQTQLNSVIELEHNISETIAKKEFLYKYQEYNLQKNFLRARDAMEERTLSVLCSGFHEHVYDTEFTLNEMVNAQRVNDSQLAKTLHTLLTKSLQSRIETGVRAFANYTQLYKAYRRGKKIFNYKFNDTPRKDNAVIVPKPLLNESLSHNYYAKRYSPRVGKDIQKVMNSSEAFQTMMDDAYYDHVTEHDTGRINAISEYFIDACEDYFHSKSTFYFESINRPLRIIQQRMQNFENLKRNYLSNVNAVRSNMDNLTVSLRVINGTALRNISTRVNRAMDYFVDWNITKTDLSREFTSIALHQNVHTTGIFFTQLRQRGQFIYDKLFAVQSHVLQIWDTIVNDNDTVEYYRYKHMDAFLRPFDEIEREVADTFTAIREDNDIRHVIGNTDSLFLKAMDRLRADLETFHEGNKMDDKFVRENFLQLDVYYKELRHEQIDQQRAYDVIALLCDIGGSMGLFIGASALTLFEIIDFLLNQTIAAADGTRNGRRSRGETHV